MTRTVCYSGHRLLTSYLPLVVLILCAEGIAQDFEWPLSNPVGTQPFGARADAGITSNNNGYLDGISVHVGVDLDDPAGTDYNIPVLAAADGWVERMVAWDDESRGLGNTVILRHADGRYSLYAHLDRFEPGLEVDDQVSLGDPLGFLGHSSSSAERDTFGTHLHFEIKYAPTLGNELPDEAGSGYVGYTPGHPSLYGYRDPALFVLDSSPEAISAVNLVNLDDTSVDITSYPGLNYGPNETSPLIGQLGSGQSVVATKRLFNDGFNWYFCALPSRNEPLQGSLFENNGPDGGWIREDMVSAGETGNRIKVIGSAGWNVRNAAGTENPVIAKIYPGQQFVATGNTANGSGCSGAWHEIHVPGNYLTERPLDSAEPATGWVCSEAFIMGTAQDPIFTWAARMGGTLVDHVYATAIDTDGSVHLTGYFEGTSDFDPGTATFQLTSSGADDIFVSKLDNSGNLAWAKRMGGTGDDRGRGIAVDADGNVYTIGSFWGTADFASGAGTALLTSAGKDDIFVSKHDPFGSLIWVKQLGGTNWDRGYALTVDAWGNVYSTGYFQGTADFDPGPDIANLSTTSGSTDMFVSKLDAAGNFVWAKDVGGTGVHEGRAILVDGLGNVHTTGHFTGTSDFDPGPSTYDLAAGASEDAFVSKLDGAGQFVWARQFVSTLHTHGYGIAVDALGDVLTTGGLYGTADFDPGPGTSNLTSGGAADAFVSKLDAFGNFVWAKQFAGIDNCSGSGIVVDLLGNVFTMGNFTGATDFDPGADTAVLTSAGTSDAFICRLDAAGEFVDVSGIGGILATAGSSIALDGSFSVYATGVFQGTADFDPGSGVANLTSAGGNDIFVVKLALASIWVDFSHDGVEQGSNPLPYNTLNEAVTAAPDGRILTIKGDSTDTKSPESILIGKPITIRAINGAVQMGSN